uniref:L1 transposable element RRM domain-containing protein n=1 Tax=Esox lucius TaxID=8010 RepID=A0A6Q2YUR6_ESOLU
MEFLQEEVSALQSKLVLVTEENVALRANVEDLVSRSKRQNIRVVGLPEDIEGKDARQFMTELFTEVAGDALPSPPEFDCAHLRPNPRHGQNPRPIIVRFHCYVEKEAVLKFVKSSKEITFKVHRIKLYEDFCVSVTNRRTAFNNIKGLLYKRGVHFGMIYPARLCVSYNNAEHYFDAPEAAEKFYHQNFAEYQILTLITLFLEGTLTVLLIIILINLRLNHLLFLLCPGL